MIGTIENLIKHGSGIHRMIWPKVIFFGFPQPKRAVIGSC